MARANDQLERWQLDGAIHSYRQVLAAELANADANHNLGMALLRARRAPEAVEFLRRALDLRPGWDSAQLMLGMALEEIGDTVGAGGALRSAAAGALGNAALALHADALGPSVFDGEQAIDSYLDELDAALDRHLDESTERIAGLDSSELLNSNARPPFVLGYLGRDLGTVLEKWASVFAPRFAGRPEPIEPMAGDRRRVGWVVTPAHEGTFIVDRLPLLKRFDADELDVMIFAGAGPSAARIREAAAGSVRVIECEPAIDEMAASVRAAACHVAVFWECGTDTLNYFLPFERLAPIQALDWGTPHTSGLPVMDHHLSSAELEPVDADDHYCEQLVRFDTIPAFLERRDRSSELFSRSDLGLSDDRHLYVCGQNPLKLHPSFDGVIADIVRRDPSADIVLFNKTPGHASAVQRRMENTIPDAVKRVRWADTSDHRVYTSLLSSADVCLDAPHYSGMNISYETFHLGTPVVCVRSSFMRGRYTAALADRMELPSLVADDLASLGSTAVALADADVNQSLRSALAERSDSLFENQRAVDAFTEFLTAVEMP